MLDLEQEFKRLNEKQKEAVKNDGNTVVLAGPGSGKTATLVIKVAHLISDVLTPPSGLACITYNNDTVREFSNRLAEFGIYQGHRLFLGTVHSFCLNCILRPYAGLVYKRFRNGISVAAPKQAESFLDRALAIHLPNEVPRYYIPTLTRLRRRKACKEDISGFDDRDLLVLDEYESLLAKAQLVDFELMVTLALKLISAHPWIRSLLSARFPYLLIDEYQDLGGPLHKTITTLIDKAGIKIFAVGDPDQTIYDFLGADPLYLNELAAREDFTAIKLRFNYRSGQRLIDASQAALAPAEPREYESDPSRIDGGEIFFVKADDDLSDHASKVVTSIKQAMKRGVAAEQIVVFYLRKDVLLTDLKAELSENKIPFVAERDSKYPSSPIVRWLQDLATWSKSAPEEHTILFENLLRYYAGLLLECGRCEKYPIPLEFRIKLFDALSDNNHPDLCLRDWLNQLVASLEIRKLLDEVDGHSDDEEALDELFRLTAEDGALAESTLVDFATDGRVNGKIVLTTFHSGKGRQFDAVIIPGLVEGILPRWNWNSRRYIYEEPMEVPLREARRLFYVGFTRARKQVYLIYSKGYIHKGHPVDLGVSRFAIEINDRLKR